MNFIKSIYVMAYIVLATSIAANAVERLVSTGDMLSWGGVLLVYVPFLLVLSWIMVFRNTPRTSARFPVLVILGVIGVAASSWGYLQGGSRLAAILAVAGLVGFLLYVYWYSSFYSRHSDALEVGQMLPDFELTNVAGESVSSSSLTDKPVVWIFYRGNWCPLCMAQIKEVAAQYQELEKLGARVALVSPQPHKFTKGLAKKFDVSFEFLTDDNNKAARKLGIAQKYGVPMGMQVFGYNSETVLPTVIITETGGRIRWAHETDNYRVRPDPDVFLAVLR
jgi:peroxiredoxin